MPRASSRINYLSLPGPNASTNSRVTGQAVLSSIVDSLGNTADLVERIGRGVAYKTEADKAQKERLCNAIVDGTNSLTALFHTAASEWKMIGENTVPGKRICDGPHGDASRKSARD
jgi:hypothetical protein